jgi:hypothetical protein
MMAKTVIIFGRTRSTAPAMIAARRSSTLAPLDCCRHRLGSQRHRSNFAGRQTGGRFRSVRGKFSERFHPRERLLMDQIVEAGASLVADRPEAGAFHC